MLSVRVTRVRAHADESGSRALLRLEFAHGLPAGYHRVDVLADGEPVAQGGLAVAPPTCYRPDSLRDGGRTWGLALQLYAVRSRRNWGIGDFSDLAAVVRAGGRGGYGVVGVSPLHALFPHNPRHCSPYSPSSRLFLNVLYIDVAAVMDFDECEAAREEATSAGFLQRLEAVRAGERVDYAEVAALKLAVLRRCTVTSGNDTARPGPSAHARSTRSSPPAARHCDGTPRSRRCRSTFTRPIRPCGDGPPGQPSIAGRRRARSDVSSMTHGEAVEFYHYLQWQADLQLRACAEFADAAPAVARALRRPRGLGRPWRRRGVGEPGPVRGRRERRCAARRLQPARPGLGAAAADSARDCAQAGYCAVHRDTARQHAARRRVAHRPRDGADAPVLGAARPCRRSTAPTCAIPCDDLLGLFALESHRNRCLVIGEDLGTVPEEVRATLTANDVLSTALLMFEREAGGGFKATRRVSRSERWSRPARMTCRRSRAGGRTATSTCAPRCGLSPNAACASAARAERARGPRAALARGACAGRADHATRRTVPRPTHSPMPCVAFSRARRRRSCACSSRTSSACASRPICPAPSRPSELAPQAPAAARGWGARRGGCVALARAPGGDAARRRDRRPCRRPARHPARDLSPAAAPRASRFRDATRAVPYLAALGISHVYCSPYLRARPGSQHGYDIVDHDALNPEIGTRRTSTRSWPETAPARLGQIDRHRAEPHGRARRRQRVVAGRARERPGLDATRDFFDIDWAPADPAPRRTGAAAGARRRCTARCSSAASCGSSSSRAGMFAVRYFDHRFPVDPAQYPRVLSSRGALREAAGDDGALARQADGAALLPERGDRRRVATTTARARMRPAQPRRSSRRRAARGSRARAAVGGRRAA